MIITVEKHLIFDLLNVRENVDNVYLLVTFVFIEVQIKNFSEPYFIVDSIEIQNLMGTLVMLKTYSLKEV